MMELDHLLWAAPDRDDGAATLAASTGVVPAAGGSHPGFGTRNTLLSLGSTCLKVIAPDPADAGPRRLWRRRAAGRPGGRRFRRMSRTRPDGLRLAWAVQRAGSDAFPDLVPFAVGWQDSPHPAETTPPGCVLRDFAALHPEPEALAAPCAALGAPVAVRPAPRPGLAASLETPRGTVLLRSP